MQGSFKQYCPCLCNIICTNLVYDDELNNLVNFILSADSVKLPRLLQGTQIIFQFMDELRLLRFKSLNSNNDLKLLGDHHKALYTLYPAKHFD